MPDRTPPTALHGGKRSLRSHPPSVDDLVAAAIPPVHQESMLAHRRGILVHDVIRGLYVWRPETMAKLMHQPLAKEARLLGKVTFPATRRSVRSDVVDTVDKTLNWHDRCPSLKVRLF